VILGGGTLGYGRIPRPAISSPRQGRRWRPNPFAPHSHALAFSPVVGGLPWRERTVHPLCPAVGMIAMIGTG
jgi:hypothetical protein